MELYQTEKYRGYDINIYYHPNPENPREWWHSNSATFVCQHRNYVLGDAQDLESEATELLEKYVKPKDIIDYFCKTRNAKVVEDKDGRFYEFTSIWSCSEGEKLYINAKSSVEDIAAEMTEDFSILEKLTLAESTGEIVWLPISMYEHSGVTIWLGDKMGHPDSQWDCSSIGFAYVEKCTAEKAGALHADEDGLHYGFNSWEEWAYDMMEGEMRMYDLYVKGDVFIYKIEGGNGYFDEDYIGGEFYGTSHIPRIIKMLQLDIDDAWKEQSGKDE